MIEPGEAARLSEKEPGGRKATGEAETLGITRFLGETYVVGGHGYTSLTEAVDQGRRLQAWRARP